MKHARKARSTGHTIVAASALALLGLSAGVRGQTYHVVDLGSLGGIGDADAFAVLGSSSPATAVGFATEFSQNHRGILRFNGVSGPIPPLSPDLQNIGFAVDGYGQVYGVSYTLGNVQPRAYRANAQGQTLLGNFVARGVNATGDVAGNMPVLASDGIWETHACVYSAAGTLSDLGTLATTASSSAAQAINDAGLIVGQSAIAGNLGSHATVWFGGSARDLGTLGGTTSGAYAINNAGVIVGWSATTGASATKHAVRFTVNSQGVPTGLTDLGVLTAPPSSATWSYAYGVNDAGQIVGQSNAQAFVILRTSGAGAMAMQNLNGLVPSAGGWNLVTARAIDSKRRIVGMGVNALGYPRPVLLVPCDADVTRDGNVTVQDVFEFLGAWFSGDSRADANLDGTVGVQDVFDFLAGWFAGCEG